MAERHLKNCSEADLRRTGEAGYKLFLLGGALKKMGEETGDRGWETLGALAWLFVGGLGAKVCIEVERERRIRRRWPVGRPRD